MPRFNEQEKEQIQKALLMEGAHLFTLYGIKKVTIDDIVKAVNIAKASFYRFYEGKEYLFLDIVQKQQEEIFTLLENLLHNNQSKSDKERVKEVFFAMSELVEKYPLLINIDKETVTLISRKISPQRLQEFASQGFDAVKAIEQNGITFKYDAKVISQIFHAFYESWISLQEQPQEMQATVIIIMLEGILQQIL